LKRGIVDRKIFPIFGASPVLNVGVLNILNFVVKYCPLPSSEEQSRLSTPSTKKETDVRIDPSGNPSLFVFKTVSEPHVGELSFFKVMTGTVSAGMDLLNETNSKSERLGQVFVMSGRERKEVTKLNAGDLGAVVKLKDTHTNNTLSFEKFSRNVSSSGFSGSGHRECNPS